MPIIESSELVMEGKHYPVFCRACKNVFNKLVEGCNLNFMDNKTCRISLNTAKPMARKGTNSLTTFNKLETLTEETITL